MALRPRKAVMKLKRLLTKDRSAQHPAHGDEGGKQVGGHRSQRVRKVGEDQDRDDRAQKDVEGEFQGAVDGAQGTPYERGPHPPKGRFAPARTAHLRETARDEVRGYSSGPLGGGLAGVTG
jgi:hypothetical protein